MLADTWIWDGSTWTQHAAGLNPPSRAGHAMAYDPARRRVVMFGGDAGSTFLNDTWEWDGTRWQLVPTPASPSARHSHAMAYEPHRHGILLVGGYDGTARDDTWLWDGTTWTLVATGAPTARFGTAACLDLQRRHVVLFGGHGPSARLNDTWLWDGTTWQARSPPQAPSSRSGYRVAYDVPRGKTVLFGGWSGTIHLGDTWEWDGAAWRPITAGPPPTGRYDCSLTYDPTRHAVLMFGGWSGAMELNDTWLYVSSAPGQYSTFGTGCRGAAGPPQLNAADGRVPVVGAAFPVLVTNLPSGILNSAVGVIGLSKSKWQSIPLPYSLSALGMPGCTLYVSIDVSMPLANTGIAKWSIPLPRAAHLIGWRFYQQAVVVDLLANTAGVTVSNAGEGVVGN